MIVARAGSGWQTVLADLCLILFMVTAAALSAQQGRAGVKPAGDPPRASQQAEPLALYRAGKDAPPLDEWLADQAPDPRQQLTLVTQYRPGAEREALALAGRMLAEAGPAAKGARLVVEPGEGGAVATLAYDDPALARALHSAAAPTTASGTEP